MTFWHTAECEKTFRIGLLSRALPRLKLMFVGALPVPGIGSGTAAVVALLELRQLWSLL